jgi:glycosyltransferase involved in cell wall biosynthesis
MSRTDLPDVLATADVALVPLDDSLVNRARCSVKLLDLMLAGRAIVADRVGQVPEYLEDGRTAMLVDPDEPARMAEAVVALLRAPDRARTIGAAAEQMARTRFAWTNLRGRLVEAIVG